MVRRFAVFFGWIGATALVVPAVLGLYVGAFISPGLGRTDTAEISAALGILAVALAATVWMGVLGHQGRLPGTARGESGVASPGNRSGFMGRFFSFLLVVLAASGISALVAATVVVAYVPEVYQRQLHNGSVDWIITVESEVLRETRDLVIRVPEDYGDHPEKRYPVLLVLDGEWHLDGVDEAAKTLRWMGLGEPMIVVGVVNGRAGRTVDFVAPGHVDAPARAARFLEFLETEALPAIDGDLRTTGERLLWGYSLGGSFAIYTLVHRPDLFTGRFALSPSVWRGDQAAVRDLGEFLAESPGLESYLYLSAGSKESGAIGDGFHALVEVLEEGAPPDLRWQARVVEGADHDNNSWRSTPSALGAFWAYRWKELKGNEPGYPGSMN